MKISNLTETMATPTSMPSPGQPGAKFGRSDEMLESGVGTTTAGSMAPSAKPMGKMQRRGKGSMFQGISTSEKYANSRKAGIKEDAVNEDELSEEQLQAKQKREENFKRAKDKELGNKPKSRDIITKEATGRGTWDSNASDYEGDYGGSRNWGRRHREDDEQHHLDPTSWYKVIDGKMFVVSVYPRQVAQAEREGFSPSQAEAKAKAGQQGVAEAGATMSDIRARMDARRNPAAVKPTAQPIKPTAPVASQTPKFKVGDTVKFAIGRGIPATGTITGMGPGPTQLTVKTAKGENQLDTRMKSLYLQLATPAQGASPAQTTAPSTSSQRPSATGGLMASMGSKEDYAARDAWIANIKKQYPTAQIGTARSAPKAHAILNGKIIARFPETKEVNEAGEWKAEASDYKEWSNYVKDELLSADPSQRYALAKKLSQLETKHFGTQLGSARYNTQTGQSDTMGDPSMTDTVKRIYDAIESGRIKPAGAATTATTQQTPFGTVTRPAGKPDPYHASPALASGDRPAAIAAQNQARPQQGGGSIQILRTEEDWEEALNNPDRNRDLGSDRPMTAAGFSSSMSNLPSWKVMLATIMLASKLPIIGDKVKNVIISSIKNEFGVQMSFKEALGYMQHVRTTPPEEIVSPAVWKFEKDGGDYETAIEELPDDAVDVRPAEVMSTIANNLISAGVAQEIKPGKEENSAGGGSGAFGNMASQLTKTAKSGIAQGMAEVAPPGAKAERMVKHIKKGYAKDGKLTPKEKSIAYATTWKAHNAGKVEEDCWDGYKQVGMKKKSGKTVPNCVPKK